MTTLRLILGDQLNPAHSWFDATSDDIIYVMMEIRQETDYVLHHAQKILGIFAAMRDFAALLRDRGHRVDYIAIDDPANTHALPQNLDHIRAKYAASAIAYQAPDEYRLDAQLADYAASSTIIVDMVDSEHFYTDRHFGARLFAGRRQWLMEHFYRQLRRSHDVLLDNAGKPIGGQWNFDHDNRKPWRGTPPEPPDLRLRRDHSALWQSIVDAGVKSFGNPRQAAFAWPLNRAEALQQLDYFITRVLPHFGEFQDALTHRGWRLFHSLLSFALNTKMLNPREVVSAAECAFGAGQIGLATAEGFIRQILGWREYVRGVYWAHMPGYETRNFFGHTTPLPAWFWTGKTRMRCMAHAITQSLEHAYAHHIQRLMVVGNFALLAGLDTTELHRWYLGIYIDAFEWVELPNTLGMSQFADGGLLATKPYVSSGAYIDRMSDYCKDCAYDRKARIGAQACPFNALYWDFFQRNAAKLKTNPRIGMAYRQLANMPQAEIVALQDRALDIRKNLDHI